MPTTGAVPKLIHAENVYKREISYALQSNSIEWPISYKHNFMVVAQ